MLLLIPAMILAIYAQSKVSREYAKFSQVPSARGVNGAQVARFLLDRSNLGGVGVELVAGNLTDHYDPRTQAVRLSQQVYHGTSLAALGIAAHETGHAMQHADGYFALNLRNNFFPVAQLGSNLAMPLFLIGFLFANSMYILMDIGILLFVFAVLFQVVTLPVEFNASRRAVGMLVGEGIIQPAEEAGIKKVLGAAALTYVAATATAISSLMRLLLLRGRRR